MRVNAFASGGLIPAARRGAVEEGLVEIADWFTTFCGLAGVAADDPVAKQAGLPAVDGLDMWPLISGAAPTSPRPYILLGASDDSDKAGNAIITGVVRADGYKLLVGKIGNGACACVAAAALLLRGAAQQQQQRSGSAACPRAAGSRSQLPARPAPALRAQLFGRALSFLMPLAGRRTASTAAPRAASSTFVSVRCAASRSPPPHANADARERSLAHALALAPSPQTPTSASHRLAVTDPTEHDEISKANPSIVEELQAIIAAESKTIFNPDRGTDDGLACTKAFNVHGGFWGPFLDK